MLSAYLDESGTHKNSPAMCVAGVLYDRKAVKRLDRQWKKELEQADILLFHAVEQAHLRGEFEGKSREFADQLYRKLIETIKKHVSGSIVVYSIPRGKFDVFRLMESRYSPYTVCSFMCMSLLLSLASRLGHKQVSFIIESGHEKMGELNTVIKRQRAAGLWPGIASCQFNDKQDLRPLQTADILAYEGSKRIRDMAQEPERHLRKSLKSIIGENRNHNVAVVTREMLQDFLTRMP